MTPPKPVRVLLFAIVREAVGRPELVRAVPPKGRPLKEFLAELSGEYPRISTLLGSCRYARNGRYVPAGRTRLRPGDELAIHPPFSGG